MRARYAELLCRTHYSFLQGASHPHELVAKASELGYDALAVTDLDGVYGIPKSFLSAREQQFKLITGAELTLTNGLNITLLAKNRAGYGLLCRTITASRMGVEGPTKEKGDAGLTWREFAMCIDQPQRTGLIALPRLPEGGEYEVPADYFELLKDLFDDRLYLPVWRVMDGSDHARLTLAMEWSERYGIPLVATNDVHMHDPGRRDLQDVLTATRHGLSLAEAGRRVFPNCERYLKSPEQMAILFRDLPAAITNTLRVAEQCTFCPSELRYYYPSEWIPPGETAGEYLERMTYAGAAKRYPQGIPEKVADQLRHEFKLVHELRYADYFLTIWEIVEFARSRDILCQGRGSAANSIICYCLGITAVDPVLMGLLFERFLSVERGEPPDIDVDFEHERREEVIQHIYEKYGRHRAGMVAAIQTYREKSARRDVGKALGLSSEDAEALPEDHPLVREILGYPRHLGIHSGGFTLSADPIIDTVPIEPARMEDRTIVQWDKEDLAAIGLLKVDVLSLGMLTALQKTMQLVNAGHGKSLTLATIPQDDRPTYDMICRADTVGVFQIESRAQMSMLPRLKPRSFYDLVVEVAIVRPGPIVGQMVHPFLKRRRGEEPIDFPDPRLVPILERTLGVPLFQEQVMKMAIHLAGFTPGEADQLRRAIGAWRSSGTIEKMGLRLMEGLLREGLPREFVDRVFEQVKGFSEYGFPESHAASFALLAYASSYLKCHYPAEFTCALVNAQPMGFYSNHTLIEDAKRHGARVLPIDLNISSWDCTMEAGALRLGLRIVKGLGETQAQALVAERTQNGPFRGLEDFVARARLRPKVMQGLVLGGAFESFGLSQRAALWQWLASAPLDAPAETGGGQLDLFAGLGAAERADAARARFQPFTAFQAIQSDHRSFGVSLRGHPMTEIRRALRRRVPAATSQTIRQGAAGHTTRVAGMVIVRQRPPTAKGTVFATLEDEHGFMDLILHQPVFQQFETVFVENPFLIVSGRTQKDGDLVNLIVRRVEKLDLDGLGELPARSRDFH